MKLQGEYESHKKGASATWLEPVAARGWGARSFSFFLFFQKPKMQFLFFFLSEPICKCRKLIQKFKTYHDPKKKVCGPDSGFICHSCPDTAHTLFLCSADPEPLKGKAKM